METFFGSLLTLLLLYKYVGLFLIAFVAAFAVPIPASTTLAAAGAFASQGYLSLGGVLLVAFLGNIAGDAAGFLIARFYGEKALHAIGLGRVLRSLPYRKVKKYIIEFPQSLIYFTRFLTQFGPAVNILSGLSQVPYRTFFIFDFLGEASYVLLYGLTGFF